MKIQSYGMFSDLGDAAVHGIVVSAKASGAPWLSIYQSLIDLAKSDYDRFGEATDTAVRESVYLATQGELV